MRYLKKKNRKWGIMQKSNTDSILTEKEKVIKKYVIGGLITIGFLLLYCLLAYFYIFCFEHPAIDKDQQRGILLVFLPTLATITISVFLISGTENIKEYLTYRRTVIFLYSFWLVPNIVFPLFPIVNIIPLSEEIFRLCVALFVLSLLILIPYILIFIHSLRHL